MPFNENEEALDALGNTIAQGIISFEDGFQFPDTADFFDELFSDWPKAIKGLVENFGAEMQSVTPEEINSAVDRQAAKWVSVGMDENVAFLIGNGLKTIYAGISLGAKKKAEPAEPQPEIFLKKKR